MTSPEITGSFFDLIHVNIFDAAYWTDRCRFWGEDNWRAIVHDMHGIGIDTLICTSVCSWGRPMFPGFERTVGRPIRMGCEDPLRVVVDEAERLGMTMFFGFGFRGRCSQVRDYADMRPPWPDVWFTWNTAVCDALMTIYADRPCFGGLYISYEMDFKDYQLDLYEKLIREYVRPAVGNVPLMASPGSLGELDDIDALPRQLERTTLNILAPQDYGGRSNNVDEALKRVRRNAEGLRAAGPKLRDIGVDLWANCELFDKEFSPDGRGYSIPGPIERITQQLAIQAPLVDKLICYQYQGIMNKKSAQVDIGRDDTQNLYDNYVRYLQDCC